MLCKPGHLKFYLLSCVNIFAQKQMLIYSFVIEFITKLHYTQQYTKLHYTTHYTKHYVLHTTLHYITLHYTHYTLHTTLHTTHYTSGLSLCVTERKDTLFYFFEEYIYIKLFTKYIPIREILVSNFIHLIYIERCIFLDIFD